jgi:hypothetical protein
MAATGHTRGSETRKPNSYSYAHLLRRSIAVNTDERKGNQMKNKITMSLLMLCFTGMLFVLAGCEQEGPAERAGENIDEGMERAGESIERAGENVQDTAN